MDIQTVKALYAQDFSLNDIARQHGVSLQAVYQMMKRHGIPRRSQTLRTEINDCTINAIYNDYINNGSSLSQIRKKFDLTESVTRRILKGKVRTYEEYYKMAEERNERKLNMNQLQCILGTLLGDGCLSASSTRRSKKNVLYKRRSIHYQLIVQHNHKQQQYLEYKRGIIGAPGLQRLIQRPGSYSAGSLTYRMTYNNKGALSKIAAIVCPDGAKKVNKQWLDQLTLEGIAYWFMDDGSSCYGNKKKLVQIRFHTLSYGYEENQLLVEKLNSYGFISKIYKNKRGKFYIGMSTKCSRLFMENMNQYIWPIECMRYKLKFVS